MQLLRKILSLILVFLLLGAGSNAQLLKKIKDKVNSTVNKSTGNNTSSNNDQNANDNNSSNGKPTNTKGGGLTNTTPPDVNQQIADATKSQAAGNYSDARYSIQQALMSIELQIGRQILLSLPATVNDLQKDTMENKVMSTQYR